MGIPINPHKHAKKSLWSEFWQDFLTIFVGVDDLVGVVFSVILAVFFVFRWGFFLIGKVLGLRLRMPSVKK